MISELNPPIASIDHNSSEAEKRLRIYTKKEQYFDFSLSEINNNGIYFIKNISSYKEIKDLLSDDFFKYLSQYTDSEHVKCSPETKQSKTIYEEIFMDFSESQSAKLKNKQSHNSE